MNHDDKIRQGIETFEAIEGELRNAMSAVEQARLRLESARADLARTLKNVKGVDKRVRLLKSNRTYWATQPRPLEEDDESTRVNKLSDGLLLLFQETECEVL